MTDLSEPDQLAARLRASLDLDIEAARAEVTTRARRKRRRARAVQTCAVAAMLGAAVVAGTMAAEDAPREEVAATGGPEGDATTTSTAGDPESTPSTLTPATSAPVTSAPATEAPGATGTLTVESLLGDVFTVQAPAELLAQPPKITYIPAPTGLAPGTGLAVSVERGSAADVVASRCATSPSGGSGCVVVEEVETSPGSVFQRWRFAAEDGTAQGGTAPEVATVSNGEWTLLLDGPDEQAARDLAEGTSITTSASGGPRLSLRAGALPSEHVPTGDVQIIFVPLGDSSTTVTVSLVDGCAFAGLDPAPTVTDCMDGVGVLFGGTPDAVEALRRGFGVERAP